MNRERRPPPPGYARIAKANREFIEAINAEVVDAKYIEFEYAAHTCWACGYYSKDFKPQRAHVLADRRGGANSPENYVLLCEVCHKEQPDAVSKEVLEQWLISHESVDKKTLREVLPVFEAVKAIARNRNAEGSIEAFAERLNAKADEGTLIEEFMKRVAYESSNPSPRTHRSNFAWGVAQAFVDWLDGRKGTKVKTQEYLFTVDDDLKR
ncbi:MAG TPA: HNH endonuclease signature motif containing protein [Phycisphaerae bacterium]|nr:HNH endonuclease signature motif containing protein [Phycisphaerae bacterium]